MKLFNKMTESELLETMAEYYEYKLTTAKTTVFSTPNAVKQFAGAKIGNCEVESFLVLFVDHQNKLIESNVMFKGTVNKTVVYPREIYKRAFELNATGLIIAHNHPSGNLKPSKHDISLTKSIQNGCETLSLRLIDHLIVNRYNESLSFMEKGLI